MSGQFLRLGANPDDPPCALCHLPPTPEGFDACIGEIAGASGACCGHGVERGYVTFIDQPVSPVEGFIAAPSPSTHEQAERLLT